MPTLVQSLGTSSPAATSLAYSSNNTAGNLLVCIVFNAAGLDPSGTVPTDTQGNTWNVALNPASFVGDHFAVFYVMNCAGGANTVTPANHGTGFIYEISEFSGVATSSAFDQATAFGGGGFPASITTTANGELIVGVQYAFSSGSIPTITVGSGLTTDLNPIGTQASTTNRAVSSGYETQTNSGSFSMSQWTSSGTINGGCLFSFKASASANGNATLTGLSLTSATGQPIAGALLFGQALTTTQGSLIGSASALLTGASLTATRGQPIAGALLFGQSLTSAQGTLFGNVTVPLTGAALTSTAGTVVGQGGGVIAGASLTATRGAITATTAVITGVSLTAAPGTLTATGNGNATFTGAALTSTANSLFGSVTTSISQQSLNIQKFGVYAQTQSGYTVVQTNQAASFPNSIIAQQSVAFSASNTVGNALFCLIYYQRSSGTNSEPTSRAVTDDQSNTWVELQHGYNSSVTPQSANGLSLWMCSSPQNGVAPNVTARLSGSATWSFIEVQITEISGGTGWSADGGIATTYSASGTITTGTFTTIHNGDLVIGAINGGGTITAGSGFALIASANAVWELEQQSSASASTTASFGRGASSTNGVIIGSGISVTTTVQLTGQELEFAPGTLQGGGGAAISNAALTTGQGTLTGGGAGVFVSLAGQSLTSAQGTLFGKSDTAITGQSLTATPGTLTSSGAGNATLTGASLTATPGTLVAAIAVLVGQSLTAAQGTLGGTGTGSFNLTGASLLATPGVITATTAAITGTSLTATPGTLTSSGDGNASLSNQSLTASAGTTSGNAGAALVGASLTATPGTIAGNAGATLTGKLLTVSQGATFIYTAGYTLVQRISAVDTTSGPFITKSAAFAFPNTAGNVLFCAIVYDYSSGSPNAEATTRSVTDSEFNTWTELRHSYKSGANPANSAGVSLWWCPNPQGGLTPTVTMSINGGATWANPQIAIAEFSGGSNWATDGGNTSTYTSQTGTVTSPSFTTAKNGDLILGVTGSGDQPTYSTGSGFVNISSIAAEWEYATQNTAGSTTVSFGVGGTSVSGVILGQAISSGDGTVLLPGVNLFTAQGSLSDQVTTSLSGQSVSASAGTAVGNAGAALVGVSLSATANAGSGSAAVNLTGVSLTATAGVTIGNGGGNITNAALVVSQGFVTPEKFVTLGGEGATVIQGTLTPTADENPVIVGQALTATPGTLTAQAPIALTGFALSATRGSLIGQGNSNVSVVLTGASLTSTPGTLSATGNASISITGQSLTATPGVVAGLGLGLGIIAGFGLTATLGVLGNSADGIATLSGIPLIVVINALTPSNPIALVGLSLAASAGTPTTEGDSNATLTGVSLSTAQGTIAGQGNSNSTFLLGQSLTVAQGTAVGGPQPAIADASAAVSAGTMAAIPGAVINTAAVSAVEGTISPTGTGTTSLSNQSLAITTGAILAANLAAASVAGQTLTVARGTLTTAISSSRAISGNNISSGTGALTAKGGGTATLVGVALTTGQGIFSQAGILRIARPTITIIADINASAGTVIEDINVGAITVSTSMNIAGIVVIPAINTGAVNIAFSTGVTQISILQG